MTCFICREVADCEFAVAVESGCAGNQNTLPGFYGL